MTGARRLACDYIAPLINHHVKVLDVCAGDRWVKKEFGFTHGDHYIALDLKDGYDVTKSNDLNPAGKGEEPDLILSIYGLQHLLSEEARVWTLLRRIAKPTTKFVYVGRYSFKCFREENREDPLNAYDLSSLQGLALASGWHVREFKVFEYSGDSYKASPPDYRSLNDCNPNAFCARLEPV